MSDLRKAAQMALEALITAEAGLSDIGDADREPGDDVAWCESRAAQALAEPRKAITYLRAALAQPEPEPVAWRRLGKHGNWTYEDGITSFAHDPLAQALYATSPQRKPLTEDEISEIAMDCSFVSESDTYFARAIERAHGIGDK